MSTWKRSIPSRSRRNRYFSIYLLTFCLTRRTVCWFYALIWRKIIGIYRIKLLNKISTHDAGTRTCSVLELTVKESQKVNQNYLNLFRSWWKFRSQAEYDWWVLCEAWTNPCICSWIQNAVMVLRPIFSEAICSVHSWQLGAVPGMHVLGQVLCWNFWMHTS